MWNALRAGGGARWDRLSGAARRLRPGGASEDVLRLDARLEELGHIQGDGHHVLEELARAQALRNATLDDRLDRLGVQVGALQARIASVHRPADLEAAEFQVFSQWGEDGIIDHLIREVPISRRTFVEIGVEDYRESNTRFLVEHRSWQGIAIDGGHAHVRALRSELTMGWRHTVEPVTAFLDRSNLNTVIADAGQRGDIGLLSIDVDGNDAWLLEALEVVSPRILVCEYNAAFGATATVSIPYDPAFERIAAHWSKLYYGASLGALALIASNKGYDLVGCVSTGVNAFFVRRDVRPASVPARTVHDAYRPSQHRDSAGPDGLPTYLAGREAQLAVIGHLPVIDVASGARTTVAQACRGT